MAPESIPEQGAAPLAEAAAPVEAPAAPVEAAVVESAPAAPVEGAAAEPAAETVVEAPVEGEKPAEEVAPAESEKPAEGAGVEPAKPAVDGEKPAEGEAPAAPVYAEFKLPEGLQAAPEQITAFTGVLGKYGLSQEAGQELMDLHAAALKEMADAAVQRQQDAFLETRAGWVKEFDKLAGNRRNTILSDAKSLINDTIKNTEERKALWDALAITGAGDHPAVIMAWAKIARRLNERSAPPPGIPTRGAANNPAERRYGAAPRR